MFFFVAFLRAESDITKAIKSGAHCRMCHSMYRKIHAPDSAKNGVSQDSLMKECNSMTNASKFLCHIIVEDWNDHILQSKDTQDACWFACDDITRKVKVQSSIARKLKPRSTRAEPLSKLICDECISLFSVILDMFKEDSSKFAQPDVNPFLKICKLVPMFQDMCHLITEEKVARVYDYIASNVDPREVCITYGVC